MDDVRIEWMKMRGIIGMKFEKRFLIRKYEIGIGNFEIEEMKKEGYWRITE
jgi:hypothetical protein